MYHDVEKKTFLAQTKENMNWNRFLIALNLQIETAASPFLLLLNSSPLLLKHIYISEKMSGSPWG